MPSFQGIFALVDKAPGVAEPSFHLQHLESKQATRSNSAKNQGVLRLMFELIQKRRSKMVER